MANEGSIKLNEILSRFEGKHLEALKWFRKHTGKTIKWSEIQNFSSKDSRLINQAKGIYKPAYTEYALSIRTIQDGPYPDKDVEYRADGSWVLQYFQENSDPRQRDREVTNRGMMKCMLDGIPIAALIKRKKKPGVTYEILGLGLVTNWEDGFFTVEGFSNNGVVHQEDEPDATRMRAMWGTSTQPFDAEDNRDLREKGMAQVSKRRGQASFRADLLDAYNGTCCISGCTLKDALEAAHIVRYLGEHSNVVANGLLLRADIHTLFDLGLLAITEDYRVKLAPNVLQDEGYAVLENRALTLPRNEALHPSAEALLRHRKWARI